MVVVKQTDGKRKCVGIRSLACIVSVPLVSLAVFPLFPSFLRGPSHAVQSANSFSCRGDSVVAFRFGSTATYARWIEAG